jgi:hypothetical protein
MYEYPSCMHCGDAIATGAIHMPFEPSCGVLCHGCSACALKLGFDKGSPGESSSEPTRLELIAALTCAESILWMAEAYARPFPPELRTYRDAAETIRAILARCTEGRGK